MLVLSRKVGEKIFIGDNIAVTVVRVGPGMVRLGIEAPPELPVVREELRNRLKAGTQDPKAAAPATVPSPSGRGLGVRARWQGR